MQKTFTNKVTILSWAQSYVHRTSPQCQTLKHNYVVPFMHHGLPASMITFRGHSAMESNQLSKKHPTANVLYVGGLGSNFDCAVRRCMLLA